MLSIPRKMRQREMQSSLALIIIHHTRESLGTADRDEGLIHEHVAPLGKLAERALKPGSSRPDALRKLFEDNCSAALITRKQDKSLNDHTLPDSMPDGWEWGNDPLADITPAI